MIRCKSNRKVFVMTVSIILLCLLSLVGATWALFMSDTNDGTIGVVTTAGDMKVDIIDPNATSPETESLVGKVLMFENVPEGEDAVFEPGATFYTQGFKIKNAGNIPINYRMYISEDENTDMEKFEKAFEFGVTTDPSDPQKLELLTSFSDRLEVNEQSDTYYLVVKMKETAGNEFQGKNNEYYGIGITVYAVQGNVEIEEGSGQ